MKRIKKITLISLMGVAACCSMNAVLAAVALPVGWYVEGNAGYSKMSNKNYGNNTSTDDHGFGFSGNVGYKFLPYLAGEVGYNKYADVKVKNSAGTQFGKDVHQAYDVAIKGILPVSDTGLEAFAKVGAARLTSHEIVTNGNAAAGVSNAPNPGTTNVTSWFFGAGAAYSFYPYLQGNVQWARAKGNSSTGAADLYTVGLAYIFS